MTPPNPRRGMRRALRVGFCVSGEGRLFREAVQHATDLGIRPVLLVAEQKASLELDVFCLERQIRCLRPLSAPRELFDAQLTQACIDADLDLLSLTFDKLISPQLVRHYRGRIVNVHPGLLPAFRGMRAIDQAIAASARFAGATVHEVDEGIDTGPIVAQCVLGVRRGETAASLGARLYELLRPMYLQVLAWYAEGRVFHDQDGHAWVRDALYGDPPISPSVERRFPVGND